MSLVIKAGNSAPHELIDGNPSPLPGPNVVTYTVTPNVDAEGNLHPAFVVGTSAVDILRHFVKYPGAVKHLSGNELVQDVVGLWEVHSAQAPSWVAVVHSAPYPDEVGEDFERFLADYWQCARGVPGDLEETHYTQHGSEVFEPGRAPLAVEGA